MFALLKIGDLNPAQMNIQMQKHFFRTNMRRSCKGQRHKALYRHIHFLGDTQDKTQPLPIIKTGDRHYDFITVGLKLLPD